MEDLKKALAKADENFLISISNKGIYKRACKDVEGAMLFSHEENGFTLVEIGSETVTVKPDIENSVCTCVARGICRHIIGALILLRNSLSEEELSQNKEEIKEDTVVPENVSKPEKTTTALKDIDKINACAEECLEVLGSILRQGLVRVPETAPENLEVCAVRCHALKMADAERILRELSGRLSDCLERRASFSRELFTEKFCECVRMLERLSESDINQEDLGVFKQTYSLYGGNLTILPIGQRRITGGEYEGNIYYFLNMDENSEQRFMSLLDLHPVFYANTRSGMFSNISPWGMSATLSSMMKKKMVLSNAKVSGGKLSTSGETSLVMHTNANLDCTEVHDLICTDFTEILVKLAEKEPQNELERMFFVSPERCVSSEFDKYSQTYIMTVEDGKHHRIKVRAKYREETRNFIALLEKIGKTMLENPDKRYTLLATAYIDENGLNLFPIEVYDFINPEIEDYEIPEKYRILENTQYSGYILDLAGEISDYIEITLQCGLQSDIKPDRKLEDTAFNYGMKGLSIMTASFMESASVYRHTTENNCREILHDMAELDLYLKNARKKLETVSAMQKLKQ